MPTPGQNSFNISGGFAQSGILGAADMDAIRPDVSQTLFNTYGDQFSKDFELWMRMHGAMIQTQNPEGGRLFQEERYDNSVTVGADNGTSGTTLSFDIDTTEIYTISGSQYVYPQVNDQISDMTTMTRGRITAVTFTSPTVVTIVATSYSGNWSVPVAGKKFAIYSNAHPEASGDIKARIAYWFSKPYSVQIIREKGAVTDLAAGAQLFPVFDEMGRQTEYWTGPTQWQMEFRLFKEIYNTLWLGQTNAISGAPVTTTGYYDEFSTEANDVNVGAGNYVDHFQELTSLLLENSPKSNNFFAFIKRNLVDEISDDLNTEFQNQNIERVSKQTAEFLFGTGATDGMLARYDFNQVIINGTSYALRADKASYDPNVQGLTPLSNLFANTAYIMPSQTGTDAQGQTVRNAMLRYYSPRVINLPGGGSVAQKIYRWSLGALASVPTDANLKLEMHAAIWQGNQFCNLPQCGFFHKNVGS